MIIIFVLLFIFIVFILVAFIPRKQNITFYKCPHKPNSELLKTVLDENNFKNTLSEFKLYMPCGYNYVESELAKENIESPYIFGLKGCDRIVSKNNLWKILENAFGRYGASKIMPETYLIGDDDQFRMAYDKLRNGQVMICKKNLQRKLGLKFAFNVKDLEECKKEDFKVAQIFFNNSYAIQNRKVNLRIYYVVKKMGNKLEFYMNKNGKLLYTKNQTSGNITFESHITSYQMDPSLYDKEHLPHNFKEFESFIGKKQYKNLFEKIKQKMVYLSDAISYVFKDDQYMDKKCFQLFGVDVIINEGEPYILEVNKGPDMIPKCKKDIELKKTIYEETFRIGGVLYKPFKRNNFVKIFHNNFL